MTLPQTIDPAADAQAVRELVASAYCNGAYNGLDTAAMARGFHPEFAILGAGANGLDRYGIADWLAAIEQRKAAPGFDPASARRDCELLDVDVAGNAANVRMVVRKDGRLLYTDYLSLLRFSDGWKIVSKIYHQHD